MGHIVSKTISIIFIFISTIIVLQHNAFTENVRSFVRSKILGADGQFYADVNQINGINKLETNATVTVEEIFGQDQFPDNWCRIDSIGSGSGDQACIVIPSESVNVCATQIDGDTILTLAARLRANLNADNTFFAYYRAIQVVDNPVVHVGAKIRDGAGERIGADAFQCTSTGSVVVTRGFGDGIRVRGKSTSMTADPRDPRVGTLGFSGVVTIQPAGLANRYAEWLRVGSGSGDSYDMVVNGSVTPVQFCVWADPTGIDDIFIQRLSIHAQASSVKFGQFLSINTKLTNGITTEIVTEGNSIFLFPIDETGGFKHEFTLGNVQNFDLTTTPSTTDIVSTATFDPPFTLEGGSTDKVCICINDNLTALQLLRTFATGFKQEAN